MTCNFLVDGVDRYAIEIRSNGDHYTLHAMTYPPNNQGGGVSDHHLYSSGEICVSSGYEPRSVDRAKAIAMSWCEGWSQYVRTGVFPNGPKRVNVRS
jgi:hypothetical protein